MSCPQPPNSVDICPTQDEMVAQLISMLPRGRAWGTHDGGPFAGVILQFWTAVASLFVYMNQRACDLRQEFFCSTAVETLDLWNADYGLPDGCDPYASLCAKVADPGGNTCDYYQSRALAAGWSVSCNSAASCNRAGVRARAGTARASAHGGAARLIFVVDLAASAAYSRPTSFAPRAGRFRAGQKLGCAVQSLAALQCLLAPLVPAHVAVSFVTI